MPGKNASSLLALLWVSLVSGLRPDGATRMSVTKIIYNPDFVWCLEQLGFDLSDLFGIG